MQGSLLILRPVEFCSMNHNALCSASLGVSDGPKSGLEGHTDREPDSRQLRSHTGAQAHTLTVGITVLVRFSGTLSVR